MKSRSLILSFFIFAFIYLILVFSYRNSHVLLDDETVMLLRSSHAYPIPFSLFYVLLDNAVHANWDFN